MKVLRLSPDLTIVPSMVQSAEVVATSCMDCIMGTVGPDYSRCRNGHEVRVRYLLSDKVQTVVAFTIPDEWRTRPPGELGALLAATEARAHVIYETILEAIRQEQ